MKAKFYISFLTLFSAFALNAQVHIITQDQVSFSPGSLEVGVGDTIRWEWTSGNHTTTSSLIPPGAAFWDSPLTTSIPFFEYKITVAGTYSYFCFFHQSMGLEAEIIASNPLEMENYKTVNIEIYPNPSVDFVNFRGFDPSKEYNVEIFDMSGRKIYYNVMDLNKSINIENYKSGVYFIWIYDAEGIVSKRKILINR
jgi:plastocyanin